MDTECYATSTNPSRRRGRVGLGKTLCAGIATVLCSAGAGTAVGEAKWIGPDCGTRARHKIFSSENAGGPCSYHILLPRSYQSEPAKRYPVIYWLHGSGGSSGGCPGVDFVSDFYSSLMESGAMPEAIVVFPNGLDSGMWCDSRDGRQRVESMLVHDLVPHIDSEYRSVADRGGRAIEGFSMGGYGAGRIGFKHSDKFCAVTMYGAGPLQDDFLEDDRNLQPKWARKRIFRDVYGSDMDYYIANSPSTLALKITEASHLRQAPSVRIVVGSLDPLLRNNRKLSGHLARDCGVKNDYTEVKGVGHDARGLMGGTAREISGFYTTIFDEKRMP